MTNEALNALMQVAADNDDVRAALSRATASEDVIAIAAANGITVTADDLRFDGELSDAELDAAAGGTILHPTMSVFCGTNGNFCTFNPYACQSAG